MNEMKRSSKELDPGLKGELTITSNMEELSNALFFDQVDCTGYYIVSGCCIKDTERCDSVKQCTDGNNNRNCS